MVEHAVALQDVTFRYGSHEALRAVSLAIPPGSVFGLVGPNGAGKTTTLHLVTTLLVPSSGQVSVCGHDAVREAPEARRRIGYAPEEPLVYSGLTAREFVELSATLHGLAPAAIRGAVDGALSAFGLEARADDVIASFSKGMRRKALLAAALVHDPDVLVLDEPLEGLDVIAQQALKEQLLARAARGRTVLYSTHILEVVEGLCTHVAVLREGRLLAAGSTAEVKAALGVGTLAEAFRPAGGPA